MRLICLALGALLVTATQVLATGCAPREQILSRLSKHYGEAPQAAGLDGQGMLIEVFASSSTGSWTILKTEPDGNSCLIASGQAFHQLSPLQAAFEPNA